MISQFVSGRAFGKNSKTEQMIKKAEDRGEWVVVANVDGYHCSRCNRDPYECKRLCIGDNNND